MNFPLDGLGPAVATRAESWERLRLEWRIRPVAPNYGKPVVVSEFESVTWSDNVLIWISGEAELDAVRMADYHAVSKHYDLSGLDDLGCVQQSGVRKVRRCVDGHDVRDVRRPPRDPSI